jgi:hypothetical protein
VPQYSTLRAPSSQLLVWQLMIQIHTFTDLCLSLSLSTLDTLDTLDIYHHIGHLISTTTRNSTTTVARQQKAPVVHLCSQALPPRCSSKRLSKKLTR